MNLKSLLAASDAEIHRTRASSSHTIRQIVLRTVWSVCDDATEVSTYFMQLRQP